MTTRHNGQNPYIATSKLADKRAEFFAERSQYVLHRRKYVVNFRCSIRKVVTFNFVEMSERKLRR